MKLLLKLVRKIVGKLILFFDAIIPPKKLVSRTPQEQQNINSQTKHLQLYQFKACPFCVKVRRHMRALKINVELKDAKHDQSVRKELLEQGGKIKVPCLKITKNGSSSWMYESSDINAYLSKKFA